MPATCHILNGDALHGQFPASLAGEEVVVLRECFVEGDVTGQDLAELLTSRARFLVASYPETTQEDYFRSVAPELCRLAQLAAFAEVVFWFEEDLFCQVNWWFALHQVLSGGAPAVLSLARPPVHTPSGFGGLSQQELMSCFTNRTVLTRLPTLSKLWPAYQDQNLPRLLELAEDLEATYPFLLPAVQAHRDRQAGPDHPSKLLLGIVQIMNDLKTEAFGPIFQEFCRRAPIYGFGDAQVKRLLPAAIAHRERS